MENCVVKLGTGLRIFHVFDDHVPNFTNALCVWKIIVNPAIVDVGYTSPYHHINHVTAQAAPKRDGVLALCTSPLPIGVQALGLEIT